MLEAKLFTVLSGAPAITALVGGRIYPQVLPQTPTYPAVTYQRVAGNRENHLRGYADLENAIIQIDAWAATLAGAIALGDAITTAMYAATTFAAILPGSPMDTWEDDVEKHRRSLDFSCWNRE